MLDGWEGSLWRLVHADFELESHQVETLRLTVLALTRLDAASKLIDEQGVQIHHTAGRTTREQRVQGGASYLRAVLRGMREL